MSTVRVRSTIGDLERDLLRISKEAPVELRGVVVKNLRAGNRLAKDFARESAGAHGKHYPNAFTTEMHASAGHFYSGEYGPDSAYPQGGMEFEFGSRNQPPHLDLAKSADIIGPKLASDTGDVVDRLFW